ncbi:MAG: hypothetical protein QNJ91_04205 [Gammaproteobacteria bacterium]|nr:hypothetical protein [Gammaproteobacteria bacterium]
MEKPVEETTRRRGEPGPSGDGAAAAQKLGLENMVLSVFIQPDNEKTAATGSNSADRRCE